MNHIIYNFSVGRLELGTSHETKPVIYACVLLLITNDQIQTFPNNSYVEKTLSTYIFNIYLCILIGRRSRNTVCSSNVVYTKTFSRHHRTVVETMVTTERTKLSAILALTCPLLGGNLWTVSFLGSSQLVVVSLLATTLEARWLPTFFTRRELGAAATMS